MKKTANQPKLFTTGEPLKFGWQTAKQNFWFFARIILFVVAINILPEILPDIQSQGFASIIYILSSALLTIALWVIGMIINMGLIKISLLFVDGKKSVFRDLFSVHEFKIFIRYFVASLLYSLMVTLGFIIFIVPGIILGIKYYFYSYNIVDKQMGIVESFAVSNQMTYGHKKDLFIYALAVIGLNLLGILLLVIGLLWTIPTVFVGNAYLYRKLSSARDSLNKNPVKNDLEA